MYLMTRIPDGLSPGHFGILQSLVNYGSEKTKEDWDLTDEAFKVVLGRIVCRLETIGASSDVLAEVKDLVRKSL